MSISSQRRRIEAQARSELRKRYGSLSKAKKRLRIKSTADIITYSANNYVPKKKSVTFRKALASVEEQQAKKKARAFRGDRQAPETRAQFRERVAGRKVVVGSFNKRTGFRAVSATQARKRQEEVRDRVLNDLQASTRRLQRLESSSSTARSIAIEKSPSFRTMLQKLESTVNVVNKEKVVNNLEQQLSALERAPYNEDYKKPIRKELKNYLSYVKGLRKIDVGRFPPVKVGNIEFVPKSGRESQFYKDLASITTKQAKKGTKLNDVWFSLGLEVSERDRWYTKALKGVPRFGTSIVDMGSYFAGEGDKVKLSLPALLNPKTRSSALNFFKKANLDALKQIPKLPKAVGKGLNPMKPENWFDIMLVFTGFGLIKKAFGKFIKLTSRGFIAPLRNAEVVIVQMKNFKTISLATQRIIRSEIKKGINVNINKKRLLQHQKLVARLNKDIAFSQKLLKNPKNLPLGGSNPYVESTELLKLIGKDTTAFHATSVSPKALFGQTFAKTKSVKEILSLVKKSSGKARRAVQAKAPVEKALLAYVRRFRAVIGGGKAQNVFVKKFLSRKTQDYDLLIANHASAARQTLAFLKRKFPQANFEIKVFTAKGLKTKVYRIKMNGKDLADFDSLPKGLKPIKVGKDWVADPKFLAKRKLSTIDDPLKANRIAKDKDDLRRLVGSFFKKKSFENKVKDPKTTLTVRPQPKNMGVDRARAGETQFFWDIIVPTNYAYASLGKSIGHFQSAVMKIVAKADVKALLKKYRLKATIEDWDKLTKKKGFSKSDRLIIQQQKAIYDGSLQEFSRRMNNIKNIKSNARITVIKTTGRVADMPPRLKARAIKSAQGKLSVKQQQAFRRDLVKHYANKPGDLRIGSKVPAEGAGERQLTTAVGTRLVARKGLLKIKKRFSQDPLTGVWIDVVEVGLNNAPKSVRSGFRKLLRDFKKSPFKFLKPRFTGGDLAKMRRFKKTIAEAERLTLSEAKGFLAFSERIFRRHGVVGGDIALKGAARRVTPRVRKGVVKRAVVVRPKTKRKKAKKKPSRPPRKPVKKAVSRKRVKPRAKPRVVSRARKRPSVRKRILSRTKTRTRARPRPRKRVVSRSRLTPRKKPRTETRPRPRPRPRKRVRARPRPRPRPRSRTKARPRPRPMTRTTYRRFVRVIPTPLRVKVRNSEKKKRLTRLLQKVAPRYRPSLAAVIFDITSYKIPKSISGFEVRPIIIRK